MYHNGAFSWNLTAIIHATKSGRLTTGELLPNEYGADVSPSE
jgi:hypothetical protein